mgnify:CR=1 FL=1
MMISLNELSSSPSAVNSPRKLFPASISAPRSTWFANSSISGAKVSKRSVFTPQVLSEVLQDKMRADANHYIKAIFQQEVREKKKGKNHDLTVAEYKVAKEEEKIEKLSTDKIGLEV